MQLQRKTLSWVAAGAVVVTAGAMGTAVALKPSPADSSAQVVTAPASIPTPGAKALPPSSGPVIADAPVAATDPARCAAAQLTVGAQELTSPADPSEQLFSVEFTAKAGASCSLVGYPADLRFTQADGTVLGLVPNVPAEPATTPVTVRGDATAVFYVRVPHRETTGQPAAQATFTLPNGDSHADRVTVAWPAPLQGIVDLSPIQPPAN